MFKWLFGSQKEKNTEASQVQSNQPEPQQDDSAEAADSHYINAADVKKMMDEGVDFTLIDVREPQELEICHVEGAKHIPMNDIHGRYQELGEDPNQLIVVMCHHGSRSEMVMHQLWGLGYQNTKNLVGGIDAWSLDVDPKVPRY